MKLTVMGSNQTEVATKLCTVFFSYNTPVVMERDGKLYKTEKHWSVTTSKHINNYVGDRDTIPISQKRLDEMVIKFID